MTNLLAALLWILTCLPSLRTNMLQGSDTPCNGQREGERVVIPGITDLPCIDCSCRKGYVECIRHDCVSLEGCHAILFDKPNNSCCHVCKGCQYNNIHYPSGSSWRDAAHACITHHCQAGVVTQTAEKCYVDCDHPLHIPGHCCPSCSDCVYQGVTRSDGETFPHASDGNVSCSCQEGRVYCTYRTCPVQNCPDGALYTPRDGHCPVCKGKRKVFAVSSSCFFAKRVFAHGTIFRPDSCTTCTCHEGTVHCERETCPHVQCDVKHHMIEEGSCCPKCPDQQSCVSGNVTFPSGHHWVESETCSQCRCQNGVIHCSPQTCPPSNICPQGQSLKSRPGDCCPVCVRDDSICSVTVNSHHVTFDARAFHAHGTCRYHLARDCKHHAFFVKIRNSARATDAFWIELVTVKIRDAVIHVFRSLQARVDHLPVSLPYVRSSRFAVRRVGGKIVVDAYEEVGLKVIWDGMSLLEVTVGKEHRGNLCGLCGNNNGDPTDDFRNKRGAILKSPDSFLRAWRVRGVCHMTRNHVTSGDLISACRPGSAGAVRAERYCGGFFHREFNACTSRLDVMPYISMCLRDACQCQERASCHHRSLRSLARRCKRAGFHMRWWHVA